MLLRSLAACAVVVMVALASGCGDDAQSSSRGEAAPSSARTSAEADVLMVATPRGLAAGLLSHMSSMDVATVGGSDERGAISAMVSTNDPDLETVHVYVRTEPDFGALPCGTDSFYKSVSCETNARSTTEVLVRVSENNKMPVLEGRFYDKQRKSVLVQVWGSRSAEAERLVRDLLSDPLLGAVTSTALNEEGEQLEDFEALVSEVTVDTS